MTQSENYNFPPELRLRKAKEFARCNQIGKRQKSKHLLFVYSQSDKEHSRLGLVVSKKVDKRAVYRNKLKRKLRELFRNHHHLFVEPIDIVIVARQNAAKCSYADIRKEFIQSLKKVSILE